MNTPVILLLFYLKHDINNIAITKVVVIEDALQVLDVVINHCRESGERPADNIMSTITTTIKSIRVANINDAVVYHVEFTDNFPAIIKQGDTYVQSDANYINFNPRALIAQTISCVPGVDTLYTKKHEAAIRTGSIDFGAAELTAILRNAKIELERTQFAAGEEYVVDGETRVHEYAGYTSQITSISVTDRVQSLLDKIVDSVLSI